MNAREFAARFAKKCGISKALSEDYCEAFTELLNECFDEMEVGDRLTFYGFGTFTRKQRPSRLAGSFTGEGMVTIPPVDRIAFTRSMARIEEDKANRKRITS